MPPRIQRVNSALGLKSAKMAVIQGSWWAGEYRFLYRDSLRSRGQEPVEAGSLSVRANSYTRLSVVRIPDSVMDPL